MAGVKSPRVNERETRAERFINDCLEARVSETKQSELSLGAYRNKGGDFLRRFPPNLSGEKLHFFDAWRVQEAHMKLLLRRALCEMA
jgi:hypothetical protein